MTAQIEPDDDPMPQAPVEPDLDACCGNGCDPCIFDLYDLAKDAYRQALRAWQARHPEQPPSAPSRGGDATGASG
ncbi:MAG: hypothetical protein JO369_01255 [Paucibacter sp.]|nr:hypothetical protein [Roseateles sp.]